MCIVSRSPRGLRRMMSVFVEVFGTFILTMSASKMEAKCTPIPRAPATQIVFNATGQQYRQTASFTYLEGTVTKTPNLSDEIDRRIRAGWISSKRYTREPYDRPKTRLLALKAQRVMSEVVKTLLYGCATWTPLKGPLHEASYSTPYDVALNPMSLVQVAEQAYPLLHRRTLANRMREHHKKVVVVGDAAPHG